MLERPHFSWKLIHPKYWPVLFAVLIWWVVVQVLPFRLQMWLGTCIGYVYKYVARERNIIARKNIDLCFPELSEKERKVLHHKNMISNGRALFDTGIAWFWPYWRLKRIVEVQGLEELRKAKKDGKGILLFTYHFTSLELTTVGVNRNMPESMDGVYRPNKNPVYDYIQRKGRERHSPDGRVITRFDVRGMVRSLRQGRTITYLPDQDYGLKSSVFVPFLVSKPPQ